uniref:CCDC66 domain-containing protein n=1 Tax=Strigamia maritima TaxID=126957 RepID=T1J693_STRMM
MAASSDLLTNLEYFLREQRSKLENDKEKIEKSTNPRHESDENIPKRDTASFHRTSACQTDISLPNPRGKNASNDSMFDYGSPGPSEFHPRNLNDILRLEGREERKTRSAPVDYDDLLARKREEEARYRYFNHFGPRDTYSGGYLFDKHLRHGYMQGFERNLVVDELADLLTRLQTSAQLDSHPPIYKPDPSPNLFETSTMIPEKEVLTPSVGVIPQGGNDHRRTHRERQRLDAYRLELEEQIREQKERKKQMLAEERRDVIGNGLHFGGDDLPSTRYEERQRRRTFVPEETPRTDDGVRKLPEKWHDGHWPLPEKKDDQRCKANYQEALRMQIEEKKRREREEKEAQRWEEEKLARKLEADRVKIQTEFEAEQRRQARKEEEARANAEALVREQESQRIALARTRRSDSDKEWWEREKEKNAKTKTPSPRAVVAAEPLPRLHTPKSARETWRLSVPEDTSHDTRVSTRTGVLGQLSAMRRRLQDEQQRIGNKTRDQDDDDYQVFDNRKTKNDYETSLSES